MYRFATHLGAAAAILLALGAVPPYADGQTLRIESEYKLAVPDAIVADVWDHLSTRYIDTEKLLGRFGGQFQAVFAEELFVDQYFDTPELTMLNMQGGIRHRTRYIVDGADHAKDGRELVQVKLARPGDLVVNRSEIKFEVRNSRRVRDLDDAHPVIGKLKRSDRQAFGRILSQLDIEPQKLMPSLLLQQRRRRIYISRDGQPFATITLDDVHCGYWYRRVNYTELEMELNEIAYTAADADARAEMQAINTAMKRDLLETFPAIAQDQTPKYNKAFDALSEKFVWFGSAFRYGMPWELTFGCMGAAVTAAGYALWRTRRRRAADLPHVTG